MPQANRRTWGVLAAAAAAAALGLTACRPDLREKTVPHLDDRTVRRVEGSDFDQMIAVCRIKGFQRLDFEREGAEYEARRDKLDAGRLGEARRLARQDLHDARAGGDPKEVEAAEERLVAAEERWRDALAGPRAEVMAILSLEQQRDWAGYVLYHHLLDRFRPAGLGEAEKLRLRELANEQVEEIVEKSTVRKDPFLERLADEALIDRLVERATERILDPIQREKMAQAAG